MATNYSGNDQGRESRPKTNKTHNEDGRKNYSGERRNYNKDNRDNKTGERKEFRNNYRSNGTGNQGNRTDGEHRNSGFARNGNSDYRQKLDRNNGGQYRGGNGRSFDKGFDKDSDEEKVIRRKPVQKDSKPKEGQTEKIEIMNRLEKEKKAMKKKATSKKEVKHTKHQARPKRTGNIDWTNVYENDEYDDDDLDMYY